LGFSRKLLFSSGKLFPNPGSPLLPLCCAKESPGRSCTRRQHFSAPPFFLTRTAFTPNITVPHRPSQFPNRFTPSIMEFHPNRGRFVDLNGAFPNSDSAPQLAASNPLFFLNPLAILPFWHNWSGSCFHCPIIVPVCPSFFHKSPPLQSSMVGIVVVPLLRETPSALILSPSSLAKECPSPHPAAPNKPHLGCVRFYMLQS